MTILSGQLRTDPSTVVVIGDALIDEIHRDGAVREFVGGAALNVAVGLAILGIKATLIAMVGDDRDGTRIRLVLEEHGVELIATPGPGGSSRAISQRRNGEPSYEFNAAAQARRIDFSPLQRQAISDASLVVVSCFPFDDADQSKALAEAIKDPAGRLIIDPNPREGMMRNKDLFRESFERFTTASLLVKVGDEDSALLYQSSVQDLQSHLLAIGATAIVATRGHNGVEVATADGVTARKPISVLPGPIVDTMGAGDAVLAASVESILAEGFPHDNTSWNELLERAMRVAAATCRREGALLRVP